MLTDIVNTTLSQRKSLNITNEQFLKAIFGDMYVYAHVTSFTHDPGDIPKGEHLRAWAGGYYKDIYLQPQSNQFYTVSLFVPDEKGKSRRRKASFSACYVIGLDDVKEKLPIEQVNRLPPPSIVIHTSLHSEQWLYILDTPETNRSRVDNLQDGLIANGLAPGGKDPGQKGVTRFLRLPEGFNTKFKRILENGGAAPSCDVSVFEPSRRYTMEELAEPFGVNLNMQRKEGSIEGAANIPNHPLLQLNDILHIKEVRSEGRFDITCPWVDEHTDADDSGSAIFTNKDGTMGFKCHHGACQHRTGADLMRFVADNGYPNFKSVFDDWYKRHNLAMINGARIDADINKAKALPPVDFMGKPEVDTPPFQLPPPVMDEEDPVEQAIDKLSREKHTSKVARDMASHILKVVDKLDAMQRNEYHKQVCDVMRWSKIEFKEILSDLKKTWYNSNGVDDTVAELFQSMVYVNQQGGIYDVKTDFVMSPQNFQHAFGHYDIDITKKALIEGGIRKVARMDFEPSKPPIYKDRLGIKHFNLWQPVDLPKGKKGDCTPWLNHFDVLGWSPQIKKHVLQYMAYTIRHPEKKINHMLMFGGMEGIGKDFVIEPLKRAMGKYFKTIDGHKLLDGFSEYLIACKLLVVNEVDLSGHRDSQVITNKLKPIAAAPPDKLSVNVKNISAFDIKNIVNGIIMTNTRTPLDIKDGNRRYMGAWSDVVMRDPITMQMLQEWEKYWEDMWTWFDDDGGWEHCVDYLITEVDLSDFNPSRPPPVTDWMYDMMQIGKSPWELTVNDLISHEVGAFKSDLIRASDAADTIRSVDIKYQSLIQGDSYKCSTNTMNKVLSAMHMSVRRINARTPAGSKMPLWIIRNTNKYLAMSGSELYSEYEYQMATAEKPIPTSNRGNLRAVK